MKFQTQLNMIINMAQNKRDWSAYGWAMRCLQVEEDEAKLETEKIEVWKQIDRIKKEYGLDIIKEVDE